MANSLFSALPVKAVIFDCDGILVNTEHLKFLAWQEALSSQNIKFSIEEYKPLIGNSSKNILRMIEKTKGLEISDQIIDLKNVKYKSLQKQGVTAIQPMVNFAHYLSENKKRLGLKLGVASSAPKEEILINLRQIGLENVFDLVISGSDDLEDYIDTEGKNKPKPYIYQHAMKILRIFPAQCVVIEDSVTGISSGVSAGCFTIAVPNIYTCNQDFSHAHLQIESFAGITIDHFLQMIDNKNHELNNKITDIISGFARASKERQRRYIITGGPGSGKTSIINELAKRGYLIAPEAATDVIEKGLQQNIQAPWMDDDYHIQVSALMAKRQEEVRSSKEIVAFFDRGHLDGITYILLQRRKLPQEVVDYVQATVDENFFDKKVFFIENLEFCEQAPHRDENLEEALEKSRQIKQNYEALGYEVINIPPETIDQRSEWIINQIQKHSTTKGPELPLITPRLILRNFIHGDIPQVIAIASHSEFSGYLRFHPEKISHDVTSYIQDAIEMKEPDLITGHREVYRLAIALKEDPTHVIGCCVFHGWNRSPNDTDQIGYFIHPKHQGHGYTTEALSYLLATYFSDYPARNVDAIVHPNNAGSQKVLKKLGFS